MAAEALHAGASGFVHAGLSPERIALAISLVLEGEGDPEATPRLPLGTVPLHEVAQALRLLGCVSYNELAPLEVRERC